MVDVTTRRSRSALMPFVLLGPAVAWLLALSVSYVVHDFLCAAMRSAGEDPPVGALRVGILALNVVLLAVTVVSGVVALQLFRAARHRSDEVRESVAASARFIGAAGMGMAVLFGFGIVLIATTPVVVGAC